MTKIRLNVPRPLAVLLVIGLAACGGQGPDLSATKQAATLGITCPVPFSDIVVPPAGTLPFVPITPLKAIGNPILTFDAATGTVTSMRFDLGQYIANPTAAVQLGKALFWDIQAGSDNKVSCATCHFAAGGDVRTRHTLNPGANGTFDGLSLNYPLTAANYPFVNGIAGALTANVDNITGSAGVRATRFKGMLNGVESVTASVDPVFGTMRQVTGVNAPTMINAVFNHRNFFNGRAQPDFNGVNIWGARDPAARALAVDATGNIVQWSVFVQNASLASQAVGPPLNPVEMSSAGRTFPDLGAKMLALKPLGLQAVSPQDSVLGSLAVPAPGKGLNTTYAAMVQRAFQPKFWNSTATSKLTKGYSLTAANWPLFWGLAIMMYEATLVSDNSPMDQYVATRVFDIPTGNVISDNPALLDQVVNRLAAEGIQVPLAAGGSRAITRDDILAGIDLFERPVPPPGTVGLPPRIPATGTTPAIPGAGAGCAFCHVGAETTSASIRNLTMGLEVGDAAFKDAGFDIRMERMFMGVRTPPNPLLGPGFFPAPPQPPPPVPYGTTSILYDNATYAVTATTINGAPANQAVTVNTYDVGWYNVGARPTAENVGIGGTDFAGRPLSWTQYFQVTAANPALIKIPGGGLACTDANGNPITPPSAPVGSVFVGQVLDPTTGFPLLSGGLSATEATDAGGSFKTASLRNVEFNGPYFHTGGKATLRQVVELYDDGGNFNNPSLSPLIRPLGMTEDQVASLVAFLLALTDDRVRTHAGPFDHPELPVPMGQDATGADIVGVIPAIGKAGIAAPVPVPGPGGAPLFYLGQRYLNLNPFQP